MLEYYNLPQNNIMVKVLLQQTTKKKNQYKTGYPDVAMNKF